MRLTLNFHLSDNTLSSSVPSDFVSIAHFLCHLSDNTLSSSVPSDFVSIAHFLCHPPHHPCRKNVAAHIHAKVATGFIVRASRNGCCGLSCEELGARLRGHNSRCVRGTKRVMKARRVVCTPTTDVYDTKSKFETTREFGLCTEGLGCATAEVFWDLLFRLAMGTMHRPWSSRWDSSLHHKQRSSSGAISLHLSENSCNPLSACIIEKNTYTLSYSRFRKPD
jgi:hypothetical protein